MSTVLFFIFIAILLWFFMSIRKDLTTSGKIQGKNWIILIVAAFAFFIFILSRQ